MKRQAWLVPTLLAFGVPLAAFAQSQSPGGSFNDQSEDQETVYLSPFEVSSDRVSGYNVIDSGGARIRRALLDMPNSIQVITKEFMSDIGANSILDATQYVSGMSYPVLGGLGGVQERQTIRGFNSYGPTYDNFRPRTTASGMETEILERVEVIKGPNPLLTVGGREGGTAAALTKSPRFEPASSIKVEMADQYFGNKVSFDTTDKLPGTESFAYRLVATHRDAPAYVPGRIIMKTINPMLTWAISDKSQLKLKGFLTNWARTGALAANANNLYVRDDFPYGTGATISKRDIKPGYVPFEANGAPEWLFYEDKTRRVTAEFTTALTSQLNLRIAMLKNYIHNQSRGGGVRIHRLKLPSGTINELDPNTGRITPNYTWALKDPTQPWNEQTNPYVSTFVPYGSDIDGVETFADDTMNWYEDTHLQADVYGKFDLGGSRGDPLFTLHTSAGVYRTREKSEFQGWSIVADNITDIYKNSIIAQGRPFLPNPPQPSGISPSSPWYPDFIGAGEYFKWGHSQNIRTISTQYYLNTQLDALHGRLLLSAGAAYNENENESYDILRDRYSGSKADAKWTPSYGVVYKVTPHASVYASHALNTTRGNWYDGFNDQPVWRDGKSVEGGIKMDFFNRRLSVSSSYFEIRRTNIAVEDPREVERRRDGATRKIYPDSLNEITNEGVEVDVSGAITPNLRILGSFTKQKMRNQAGYRQANTPDTMYNGFLRYGFSNGTLDGLSVHVGFNHIASSPGNDPNVNLTILGVSHQYDFFVPARTIYNGGASYKWKSVNFQLNIDNLLDSDKVMVSGGRHAIGLVPPRNIRLTTTYSF